LTNFKEKKTGKKSVCNNILLFSHGITRWKIETKKKSFLISSKSIA
jgi:hypothetical protein